MNGAQVKEFMKLPEPVGYVVSGGDDMSVLGPTNCWTVHYSGKGAHVVPATAFE